MWKEVRTRVGLAGRWPPSRSRHGHFAAAGSAGLAFRGSRLLGVVLARVYLVSRCVVQLRLLGGSDWAKNLIR